ncbi:MAG: hemerythrin family protein [Arthrospira sp. SH-MAG29]|nr:hemerythrin family protein [Arthrospira sp. SH-MAG29]MBS0014957.1 hemerythrin family protein [Arthrospira sp. SH-MAG29]
MAPTWNDSLKIGIPLIDFQHQQLFDQMDLLIDNLEKQRSPQQLKSTIKFLEMYINNHFKYEESCMNLYKCPVAKTNHKAHQLFVFNFEMIKTRIEQDDDFNSIILSIKKDLRDWFINHIKSIDTQLKPCLPHKKNG